MQSALCVSIHDVSPATWPQCRRLLAALSVVELFPLTLLVVPNRHGQGADIPSWYREALDERVARGDELVLHGYTHRDDGPRPVEPVSLIARRIYTDGEAEFAALSAIDAKIRLAQGLEWFQRYGWPVQGFVAPAWLLSAGTWEALNESDFAYTTTLNAFHLLGPHRRVRAPCVAYSARSAARRTLSRAWNAALHRRVGRAPIVRLALHPGDADHPHIIAQALRILDRLLDHHWPMTKAALAADLREGGGDFGDVADPGEMSRAQTMSGRKESPATAAPTSAPAKTSLG